MTLSVPLIIRLYAGDLLVAEAKDARLWNEVLERVAARSPALDGESQGQSPTAVPAVREAAEAIGVTAERFQEACHPTLTLPYIQLGRNQWESFVKRHPVRGPKAVSPVSVAATLLIFWLKALGQDGPTLNDCRTVLAGRNLEDRNIPRSIENCAWLTRKGQLVDIEESQRQLAADVARAFCEEGVVRGHGHTHPLL